MAGPSFATSGLISSFPVAGNSELYALSAAAELSVSGFRPAMTTWKHAFAAGSAQASPTLDCARPFPSGAGISGRPGTLYLPLGDGTVAAVIVESRRLDQTAEWPKYQRDAYNSGNATSVGESLNPGCP